jgi:hypothetical protein
MHPAIECTEFITAKRRVLASGCGLLVQARAPLGCGAIVAQQKYERIVPLAAALDSCKNSAYTIIGRGENGRVHLPLPRQIRKPRKVLGWNVHGIVHSVESSVKKEWFCLLRLDELNSFVRNPLRQVRAVVEDFVPIAPEIVEIGSGRLTPIVAMGEIVGATLVKAVKIIEAVRIRHSIRRTAEMPFACQRSFITSGLKQGSNTLLRGA